MTRTLCPCNRKGESGRGCDASRGWRDTGIKVTLGKVRCKCRFKDVLARKVDTILQGRVPDRAARCVTLGKRE